MLATELELPSLDYTDTALRGDVYRDAMANLDSHDGWLASGPFGYIVTDREAGEFFLRTKDAIFPGLTIAEIFQISDGPLYRGDRQQHHQRQRRRSPAAAQPGQPGAVAACRSALPTRDAALPR